MAITRSSVYHNLATLLEAGLPVVRSLRTAGGGTRGKLRRQFAAMADAAADGAPMAETMARHPREFDPLEVLLVRTGETAGNLPACLTMLSEWFAFRRRLARSLTSGMILPLIVLHGAAFIAPLPTLFLTDMTLAGYMRQVLTILAVFWIPVVAILAVLRFAPKGGVARRLLDLVVMRIPLVRRGVRSLSLSRYFRAFAMLHKAGVPIVRTASLAVEVGGNSVIMDLVRGGADSAREGRPVSEGFSPMLPREYLEIWQIGEKTGTLDAAASRAADHAGESADRVFTELCRWIPRIIYCIISVWIITRILAAAGVVFSGGNLD